MQNFNKKYENENYSILNASGLAIFSNFYLHWFFSNLSFFERDPHIDSPEGIRVKPLINQLGPHSYAGSANPTEAAGPKISRF
jgi:hypothetical protein